MRNGVPDNQNALAELADDALNAVSGGGSISAIPSGIPSDIFCGKTKPHMKPYMANMAEYNDGEETATQIGEQEFLNQLLALNQNTTEQVTSAERKALH